MQVGYTVVQQQLDQHLLSQQSSVGVQRQRVVAAALHIEALQHAGNSSRLCTCPSTTSTLMPLTDKTVAAAIQVLEVLTH